MKRDVLRVNDGVAAVAGIALCQNRSGAAGHVRAHERQQRAGMLELGRDGRPQPRMPVANLPRKSIYRIKNRKGQAEQQHSGSDPPYEPLDLARSRPTTAEQILDFRVDLDVAVRRGAELIVIEQNPKPNLRRGVIENLASLGPNVHLFVTCENSLESRTGLRRELCKIAPRGCRGNLGRSDRGVVRPRGSGTPLDLPETEHVVDNDRMRLARGRGVQRGLVSAG